MSGRPEPAAHAGSPRLTGGLSRGARAPASENDGDAGGGAEHAARATDRVGRGRQRALAEPVRAALREPDAAGRRPSPPSASRRSGSPCGDAAPTRRGRRRRRSRRPAPRPPTSAAAPRRAGHEVRQIVEARGGLAEALVARVAIPPHRVGRVDGAVRPRRRQPAHRVGEDRRRDAVDQVLRRGLDRRGRDLVRREILASAGSPGPVRRGVRAASRSPARSAASTPPWPRRDGAARRRA